MTSKFVDIIASALFIDGVQEVPAEALQKASEEIVDVLKRIAEAGAEDEGAVEAMATLLKIMPRRVAEALWEIADTKDKRLIASIAFPVAEVIKPMFFASLTIIAQQIPLEVKVVGKRSAVSTTVEPGGKEEGTSTTVEKQETLPKAFPPCIRVALEKIASGEKVEHYVRFAVASFLAKIGKTEDEIVEVFRTLPDFDEEKTRYQVHHIMEHDYDPPTCEKIRTFGSPNLVCPFDTPKAKGPLACYKKRLRWERLKKDKDGEKGHQGEENV